MKEKIEEFLLDVTVKLIYTDMLRLDCLTWPLIPKFMTLPMHAYFIYFLNAYHL